MSQRKSEDSKSKQLGMVGCGTPDIMLRDQLHKQYGKVDGLLNIKVTATKIIFTIRDESVKASLPSGTFRGKTIEFVVQEQEEKQSGAGSLGSFCGTAEMHYQSRVREYFKEVTGVLSIDIYADKVVFTVAERSVKDELPKKIHGRAVEVKVQKAGKKTKS